MLLNMTTMILKFFYVFGVLGDKTYHQTSLKISHSRYGKNVAIDLLSGERLRCLPMSHVCSCSKYALMGMCNTDALGSYNRSVRSSA